MGKKFKSLSLILAIIMLLFSSACALDAASNPDNNLRQEFSFLFFSDTQADPETGEYSEVGKLLSQAVEYAETPGLILFGGDVVNDGENADEWLKFREATSSTLSSLITATVPGNHDNYPLPAEQFDYPNQAPSAPGDGYFYSFDKNSIHFIMLDSNAMGAANEADIQWLENDLQSETAQQANWRIVVMHHPMWTVVANPKDESRAATMRENFLPLLEAYGVDLILCGHQHVYARSQPISGIIQIMAASGSKESYAPDNNDYIAISAEAPNYLLIKTEAEKLTITAYDGIHEVIDTLEHWSIIR